ncbi:MAG: response regulator [Melioribacteraceae bacterium]|nr:response regulator [Melioribacteraceae bacterium]
MLTGVKLETLEKYTQLMKLANSGNDNFPDMVSNFIVNEFNLQAIVLFSVVKNDTISVLGKSASSRQNYLRGSDFTIDLSRLFGNTSEFNINTEALNDLQISEYLVYECSVLFEISEQKRLFVKVAKNSPFSQSDIDALKKISEFLKGLFTEWSVGKSVDLLVSKKPLSETILETAQELRTPLNSIVGFISILSSDNLTSSQSGYANTIKENAQELLFNMNDLIELSKIESGKVIVENSSVNIKKLMHDVVDVFKSKTPDGQIQFLVDINNSVFENIIIDDKKIRFILNNILEFSKFSTVQGTIILHVSLEPNNKLQFVIQDTGKGISNEILVKLFDPFTISKIPEFNKAHISGLSFNLVRKYCKMLGGNITVESNLGAGSRFQFTVNYESQSKDHLSKAPIDTSLLNLPRPTSQDNSILVIEDDYTTSKLLSNYLNKWKYNPTIVNSAEQTLEIITKEKFLAIIIDINISGTNGLELLKKIHEHPNAKSTPTIVCSVEPEEQKAFMMGAVEYFQKPINYNYLVEVLTSYKLRKNSNVLCVDDDLPTLNLVKQAIETAGFNAVAENISANVMNLISDKDIDLAIVDLDMPYPNGFELIQQIKSDDKFKNLPIIIYTGKENFDDDLKKIDGLFTHLLSKKSTNLEDLADTINAMVNNKYEQPTPIEKIKDKQDEIKILFAEDYKHSQIIVTRLLKKSSFENVVVVENGQEALNSARENQFDLILMDIQMPIMNGFEAMERIRQMNNYKDTPIIALTAFAMKGDREKCLEAGATDYIPKPIDSKEFIEKVKYYTKSVK